MKNITVEVVSQSLARSAQGKITGSIWLSMAGREFPAIGWNDFVVIILNWWLEALLALLVRKTDLGTFQFMDGPYRVVIRFLDAERALLEFFDDHEGNGLVAASTVIKADLLAEVIGAAKQVSDLLAEHNWVDAEVDKLRSNLASLAAVMQPDAPNAEI